LTLGYIPGGNCILEGFNKLPPAHVLEFDLLAGTAKIRQYWCLPQINLNTSISDLDEVALLDELEGLLESSVREQLVADVTVGILLSGGVDSSLVTAMAARSSNKVQTFTIGFPGHSNHNEINHARLISKFFGTTHTELTIEQNSIDVLPLLARQFDEPVADSSMIPTFLVSQLVKSHCKVVLGGDGGDELFGGYNHYSRIVWLQKYLKWVPQHLTRTLSYLAECILPIGFRGRNWVQNMEVDLRFDVPLVGTFFNSNYIDYLLPQLHTKFGILKHGFKVREQEIGMDLIQRATRSDFRNYLVEDILVKVDRASMLNSLEVRSPLLDCRLIEFAFGKVPSRLKANNNQKKILLKRLTSKVLPPDFDKNRKQGFSVPLASWLKAGSYRELFQDTLLSPNSIFDKKIIEKLLKYQDMGCNNSERLFSLVLFELWRNEYGVTL
jgi:asparagine synthase (glutamine-hydrolysing)